MERKKIVITAIIASILLGATTIVLVVNFYPKEDKEEQLKKIEELVENVFQADNTQELGSYFHFSFKLQVSMEYLLYVIERFKFHYGDVQDVHAFDLDNSLYNYHAVMEHGNITGTIGVTIYNLINTFFLTFGQFFESYLTNSSLEDIAEEFVNFPDGGVKSLLLTRDETVLFNHTTIEKQAVASTFKLYVLKTLQEKIASDPLVNWNTEIPIIDNLKSLPSGIMHTWDNGTMVSLETFAEYMIKISDNTATDHLIHFLNRSVIESFLPLNYSVPFLKTADMFKLRYLVSNENLTLYLAMNSTAKRTYLDEVVYEIDINEIYSLVSLDLWENIALDKELEWFFTADQIAQAINAVKDLNATRQNPGVALSNQWKTVAFKGGSDAGVFSLAHAVQAENDTWYTVVMIVNNYVEPELDIYVNFEIDIQILCAKLLMFLAIQ